MHTYITAGKKTATRGSAERAIAAGADPIGFLTHPNYHVRCAAWRAAGSDIPEGTASALTLFKSLCPNIFDKISDHKKREVQTLRENTAVIAEVERHNAAAVLENAAYEKTDGFVPVILRPIPEAFVALPNHLYGEVLASTNSLARQFLALPGIVEAIPMAN